MNTKRNLFFTLLFTSSYLQLAQANTFEVVKDSFDFGLSCATAPTIPPIPDALVTEQQATGFFEDNVYAGTEPPDSDSGNNNPENTYVSFKYFGGFVSNYTISNSPQLTGNGNEVGVNHPAPSFDLINLKANLSSFYAYWNGTAFNQGNSDVDMVDNLDGTYSIDYTSLISGVPFDGCTGRWIMKLNCTTCPPSQIGLAITINASQDNGVTSTRTIVKSAGNVVLSSSLGASPTSFGFSWLSSDTNITDTDSALGTFTFDPSGLSTGIYTFTMIYNNNSTTPSTKGSSEIVLNIVDTAIGDIADDNNNGIPNKDDDDSLSDNQIQTKNSNSTTFIMSSSSGQLKLGKTSFCSGKSATSITLTDIESFGSSTCTNVSNFVDQDIKAVGVGGYFDFEIHNLNKAESVQIIIPLSKPLPNQATYRKFSEIAGWETFDTSGDDATASAMSISTGICPAFNSTAYTNGLIAGHNCIRLTIKDGGNNDIDKLANGVIIDPGAIAEIESGTQATLSSGCSISGKPSTLSNHSEWWLLLAALTWLGLSTHRKKH